MTNTAIVAVAGAGKTEWLTDAILAEPNVERALVLTYTTANQLEDALRIASKASRTSKLPQVIGWCSFLMNEIVKPYLPMLYPGVDFKGLAPSDRESYQYLYGERKHFLL